MTHATRKPPRKWIKPTAAGGSIVTLLAVLGAKYSALRGDVDTIQAAKPDVMQAEIAALKQEARERSTREDQEFRSIDDLLGKLREDVSFIRGRLDPAKAPVGQGGGNAKVAGSFQQGAPAARG